MGSYVCCPWNLLSFLLFVVSFPRIHTPRFRATTSAMI